LLLRLLQRPSTTPPGNIGFNDYDIAIQNHEDMSIDIDKYQQIQALKMSLGTKIFAMDKDVREYNPYMWTN